MKINEIKPSEHHQMMTDQYQEMIKWFEKYTFGQQNPKIRSEGGKLAFVVGGNNFKIRNFDESVLPYKFYNLSRGNFVIQDCPNLSSLKNVPEIILGEFKILRCPKLQTFENLPKKSDNMVLLYQNLKSFSGIHKHVQEIHGTLEIPSKIEKDLLGLCMIKMLKHVRISTNDGTGYEMIGSNKLEAAVDVINKHLNKGRVGVLAAQEKLIELGLDDFAEL